MKPSYAALCLILGVAALPAVSKAADKLPLRFEPNVGQITDLNVRFLARAGGHAVLLGDQAVLVARGASAVRLDFAGANPQPRLEAVEKLPGLSNYLTGSRPAGWRTGIPQHARVRYHDVYPGITLELYGNEGQLEYDWTVAPGADPSRIRLVITGADALRIDGAGNLVMKVHEGDILQRRPAVFQGSTLIDGGYVLVGEREVGFVLGDYDRSRPLVIDPVVVFSASPGGSSSDVATATAVDSAGNTYVTGYTESDNYSLNGPMQSTRKGYNEVFVTKLNTQGTALVYSTYVGGTDDDYARAIAVDSDGNAYVAGQTSSTNFPTVNAFRSSRSGDADAFLFKLNPAGSALVYSTYLGGSSEDIGYGVAVDAQGSAYVTGSTRSDNFPVQGALQPKRASGDCSFSIFGFYINSPCADAFVTKFAASGSTLVYSTFLGGTKTSGGDGEDYGHAIAVDTSGRAYVTGTTTATDFPRVKALQSTVGGKTDAFVAKLNENGSALVYSTYLGGSADETSNGIAVDPSGNAYVTGGTESTNFPTANPLQKTPGGNRDAYVTGVKADGSAFLYSTYLGGTGTDEGFAIAADASGAAWITGSTSSADFPVTVPLQAYAGGGDAFVAQLNSAGSTLTFSTHLGGISGDSGAGIALDAAGNVYLSGTTSSVDFFISGGAFLAASRGSSEVFVMKFSNPTLPSGPMTTVSAASFRGLALAADSYVTLFGDGLATETAQAGPPPYPLTLGGTSVSVTDSAGTTGSAQITYASATQVNLILPPGLAAGTATLILTAGDGRKSSAVVRIEPVAPGLFSANSDAKGVAAAVVTRTQSDGTQVSEYTFHWDAGQGKSMPAAIDLRPANETVVLVLFGTGIRSRSALSAVKVTIGGVDCEVLFAGAQGEYPGLDQLNVKLPRTLIGKDEATILLTVDGRMANPVTVLIGGRPIVSSMSPDFVRLGGSGLTTVTMTGQYLDGVDKFAFTPSAGITVTNIKATETQVTADIGLSASADLGDRTLKISTALGTSDAIAFVVKPAAGSKIPFIYHVKASSPLPISTGQVAVTGSFDFEDGDGDILWTGKMDGSAVVRVGFSCSISASGIFLDKKGQTSGHVDYIVAWSASSMILILQGEASLRLIDAAGNSSNIYWWSPGIWWC